MRYATDPIPDHPDRSILRATVTARVTFAKQRRVIFPKRRRAELTKEKNQGHLLLTQREQNTGRKSLATKNLNER